MSNHDENDKPTPPLPDSIRELAWALADLQPVERAAVERALYGILDISAIGSRDAIHERLTAFRAEFEGRLSQYVEKDSVLVEAALRMAAEPALQTAPRVMDLFDRWTTRLEQTIDERVTSALATHVEDEHFGGRLAKLVDDAVASRFEQYARILWQVGGVERAAASLEAAIDQELEGLAAGEQEAEAAV